LREKISGKSEHAGGSRRAGIRSHCRHAVATTLGSAATDRRRRRQGPAAGDLPPLRAPPPQRGQTQMQTTGNEWGFYNHFFIVTIQSFSIFNGLQKLGFDNF